MPAPRDAIVKYCEKLLPQTADMNAYIHWNQIGFDNLAKDYGQGFGTTCGFLPHYLLWRFGCRDSTLVNRSEPPEGLVHRIGQNLSIFQPVYKKVTRPSWNALDTEQKTRDVANGKGPQPGDFIIVRGGFWLEKSTNIRDRDSAHIMVLLKVLEANGKQVKWLVAQSGVSTNARLQGAHITVLNGTLREDAVMEGNAEHKGPNLVFVSNILGEEANFPRRVIGYCNLDALTFGGPPAQTLHQLVESNWMVPAINNPKQVNVWMGWYELASPGGFIPLHPTYVLLHRGHEAYRLEKGLGPYFCTARGIWTLTGNMVTITWPDGEKQSWTMATTFVPRLQTTGAPQTPNTGKLTRVQQIPPKKAPPEISPNWLVE